MALSNILVVPHWRTATKRAVRSLLEGKIIPLLLFLLFLELAGRTGAVIAALVWSLSIITHRAATGRRVPGLVVLSAIGLTAKTAIAVASGSYVLYFVQPAITTTMVAAAFLISVPAGRPLAEKLANDFCPFAPETASHPDMRRFFERLSIMWAVTSLVNASIGLWLYFTQPLATVVIVKSVLGPTTTALTVLIAIAWFRGTLRRKGLRLQFDRSPRCAGAPATNATPALAASI
jgi:hypothetical protein